MELKKINKFKKFKKICIHFFLIFLIFLNSISFFLVYRLTSRDSPERGIISIKSFRHANVQIVHKGPSYIYIYIWIVTCESFFRSFHLHLLPSARILGGPATLLTPHPLRRDPRTGIAGAAALLRRWIDGTAVEMFGRKSPDEQWEINGIP